MFARILQLALWHLLLLSIDSDVSISDEQYFYQILAWSIKSKIDNYRDELDKILRSFQVLEESDEFIIGEVPTKLIFASDSLCQIKMPSSWQKRGGLNDDANLQISSPDQDLFLLVITESKEDFSDFTLKNYFDLTNSSLITGLKDSSFSEPIETSISGNKAIQFEIFGTIESTNFAYFFAAVEDTGYYYQIISWVSKSNFIRKKQTILNIVDTFVVNEKIPKNSKSSLWEIRVPGNTVYLLGSVHILSQNDYPLNPKFETAYSNSELVLFEVNIDSLEDASVKQLIMSK